MFDAQLRGLDHHPPIHEISILERKRRVDQGWRLTRWTPDFFWEWVLALQVSIVIVITPEAAGLAYASSLYNVSLISCRCVLAMTHHDAMSCSL